MDGRKITIKDLKEGINMALSSKMVTDAYVITWAEIAEEDDKDCQKGLVIPGTLMLGTEYVVDGDIEFGTLYIPPKEVSKFLS